MAVKTDDDEDNEDEETRIKALSIQLWLARGMSEIKSNRFQTQEYEQEAEHQDHN